MNIGHKSSKDSGEEDKNLKKLTHADNSEKADRE